MIGKNPKSTKGIYQGNLPREFTKGIYWAWG
jgi:hypothetical protein